MPMVLMTIAFWGVGIPLGSWLGCHGLGGGAPLEVYGFWVGLVVGLVLASLAVAWTLRAVPDARLRSALVASTEPMRAAR